MYSIYIYIYIKDHPIKDNYFKLLLLGNVVRYVTGELYIHLYQCLL